MVVTFKGKSEYDSKYKWNDSIKSSSFHPPEEMVALEAGKPSYLAYNLNEPPLQHKKRIPDPYVTQHLLHTTNPRELQELVMDSPAKLDHKRATKSLLKSEAAGRRTVLPVSDHELSKTYQVSASQEAPPPGAKPPKSAAVSTFSPPKAPRLEKGHTHVEYPHPNPEPYNPPVQIVAKEKDRSKEEDKLKTYVVKKPPVAAASAGVPRARARTTEYQHKYPGWESGYQSKPTLNTKEMVFKSHTGIPPYMTDYIRRSSEYQKEFKDWTSAIAKTSAHARPKRIRDDMDIGLQSKEKQQQVADMRLVRSSYKNIPPQVPQFPMRRHRSEYMANYKDASKYDYKKGAWFGAQNPELLPAGVSDEEEAKKTTWVNEVGDLRHKAAYYGARHLGTHISRDHVGQLVSKGADRWDDPGSPLSVDNNGATSPPVLSDALDLAGSRSRSKSRQVQSRELSSDRAAGLPSKIPHWDFDPSRSGVIPATMTLKDKKSDKPSSIPNSASSSPRSPTSFGVKSQGRKVTAKDSKEVEEVINLEEEEAKKDKFSSAHNFEPLSSGNAEAREIELGNRFAGVLSPKSSETSSPFEVRDAAGIRTSLELGRVPTPELKTSVKKDRNLYQPVSRHHLDRTTVISKPDSARSDRSDSKQKKPKRPNSARPIISSMEEHRMYDKPPLSKTQSVSKTKKSSKSAAKPVYPAPKVDSWMVRSPRNAGNTQYTLTPAKSFGKPTEDTHYLLLSSASVPSPLIERHADPKAVTSSQPKMSHASRSAGYKYGPNASYDYTPGDALHLPLEFANERQEPDFDALDKASVASLASSRSLASETLERARNRRDFLRQK